MERWEREKPSGFRGRHRCEFRKPVKTVPSQKARFRRLGVCHRGVCGMHEKEGQTLKSFMILPYPFYYSLKAGIQDGSHGVGGAEWHTARGKIQAARTSSRGSSYAACSGHCHCLTFLISHHQPNLFPVPQIANKDSDHAALVLRACCLISICIARRNFVC